MASSDNSKSIQSHTIPFARPTNDAFQDMTAFTPPADSWIIRYPTTSTTNQAKKKDDLRKPQRSKVPEAHQLENPCRQYIDGSEIPVISNKSLGTDDHFKSAVCSKNLLKVCGKLMSDKKFAPSTIPDDADDFEELSLMNEKSRMEFYRSKHGNRRSSQSLPSSPKLERKAFPESSVAKHNPYFTITKESEPRKESSISFLTSLFGITGAKPSEANLATLAKKYEKENSNVVASASAEPSSDLTGSSAQRTRKLTPKSREYREMNMFSPTSM